MARTPQTKKTTKTTKPSKKVVKKAPRAVPKVKEVTKLGTAERAADPERLKKMGVSKKEVKEVKPASVRRLIKKADGASAKQRPVKVSKAAVEVSQELIASLVVAIMQSAEALAQNGKRKTITLADLVYALKTHSVIPAKIPYEKRCAAGGKTGECLHMNPSIFKNLAVSALTNSDGSRMKLQKHVIGLLATSVEKHFKKFYKASLQVGKAAGRNSLNVVDMQPVVDLSKGVSAYRKGSTKL